MHQVIIVAVTAVVGLAALVHAAEAPSAAPAESAGAAVVGAEGSEAARAGAAEIEGEIEDGAQARVYAAAPVQAAGETQPFVRMCVGPARLSLGGAPFTRIAFGGDGCGRASLGLVGLKFLGLESAPELPAGLPVFIEVDETEDAARGVLSVPA
ncbi:MAG: hypothetical protein PVI23_08490 [Maricaulaceae bacterium]|jgi:hypothetical protein